MRTAATLLVFAAGVGAGVLGALAASRSGPHYTLLNVGAGALRLNARTGQVCVVAIGADQKHLMVLSCTTHVTEEDAD